MALESDIIMQQNNTVTAPENTEVISLQDNTFVNNLVIKVKSTGQSILKGVNCAVGPGEILGVAGETGSGKTTLALSYLRYVRPGLEFSGGEIVVSGTQLLSASPESQPLTRKELSFIRGKDVSYVPQDPGNALPASMRLREGFGNIMKAHGVADAAQVQARMHELFAAVGLPTTDDFAHRFPHQLSGGQQQRVAIAMAFALSPSLVVMDEPTTGLDATTTRKVVELIKQMSTKYGSSIVFVSHDLRLLLELADRVAVMYYGEIVEELPAAGFRQLARHEYTRALIQAIPEVVSPGGEGVAPQAANASTTAAANASTTAAADASATAAANASTTVTNASTTANASTLLNVENLCARYGATEVTHDINLQIEKGSCLAIVGESGSGKTTTARCIAGIHSDYNGSIMLENEQLPKALSKRTMAQKQHIQYVFQNPTSALNPRKTVGESIEAALKSYQGLRGAQAREAAAALMEDVGLRADHLLALPRQLSGGQRQRVCLARALAAKPDLLICDEVTSSLDVIVQQEVIELLKQLQETRHLTVLFITHDFGLAQAMASRTMVLLKGCVVEEGPTAQIIRNPQHPYTQSLVASALA